MCKREHQDKGEYFYGFREIAEAGEDVSVTQCLLMSLLFVQGLALPFIGSNCKSFADVDIFLNSFGFTKRLTFLWLDLSPIFTFNLAAVAVAEMNTSIECCDD